MVFAYKSGDSGVVPIQLYEGNAREASANTVIRRVAEALSARLSSLRASCEEALEKDYQMALALARPLLSCLFRRETIALAFTHCLALFSERLGRGRWPTFASTIVTL